MLLFFGGRFVFLYFARIEKYSATDPLIGFFGILAYGEAACVKVRNMLVTLIF